MYVCIYSMYVYIVYVCMLVRMCMCIRMYVNMYVTMHACFWTLT